MKAKVWLAFATSPGAAQVMAQAASHGDNWTASLDAVIKYASEMTYEYLKKFPDEERRKPRRVSASEIIVVDPARVSGGG